MHQIWGWNDIFDNVYFENTLFGPFTLKYTFYKNCRFSLSGTVQRRNQPMTTRERVEL